MESTKLDEIREEMESILYDLYSSEHHMSDFEDAISEVRKYFKELIDT